MDTLLSRLPDPILSALASIIVFWQHSVVPRLRSALRVATYVAFMPMFGVGGSHFQTARRVKGNKHYVNWMAYSVLTRVLVIQVHKGKTIYTYSVAEVSPMTYLRLTSDATPQRVQTTLQDNPTYEVRWTWRYDGVYRKGIKRPDSRFPAAPRRPGQRG